jgi:hypothetical protein
MFKSRSKYGEFVDKHLGYGGQESVRETTGLNRDTITKACNDREYRPKGGVMNLLLMAARQLTGKNVDKNDFWA